MKWIIGLGNPGAKYLNTRHNVGWMLLDRYLSSAESSPAQSNGPSHSVPRWKDEFKAQTLKAKLGSTEVLFIKPQTFMNRSGEPARAVMEFYKLKLEDLLVVHDDLDSGFGAVKLQRNRGPGGHNGLKSLNEQFGTQDYTRLKLGIGRPPDPRWEIADYVLSQFSGSEQAELGSFLDHGGDALEEWVISGYDRAASLYSRPALEQT